MSDPLQVTELPPPDDDGAAAHLPGVPMPKLELPSTDGGRMALSDLVTRTVVFVFPTMDINNALLEEWTAIPGARGCTPEACAFRDRLGSFRSARVEVLGISGQSPAQQRSAVERLSLPYPLLSDEQLQLATHAPGLPTFEFRGHEYFKRVTLVVSGGRIEAALYPVFPPDRAAEQALVWLAENPPG